MVLDQKKWTVVDQFFFFHSKIYSTRVEWSSRRFEFYIYVQGPWLIKQFTNCKLTEAIIRSSLIISLLREWPTWRRALRIELSRWPTHKTKAQAPKLDRTGWKPDPGSSSSLAEISVVLFDQYPSWWKPSKSSVTLYASYSWLGIKKTKSTFCPFGLSFASCKFRKFSWENKTMAAGIIGCMGV